MPLPDPNSPAMGMLVDRWLHRLRSAGLTDRQWEHRARLLGRAVTRDGWATAQQQGVLGQLLTWLDQAVRS